MAADGREALDMVSRMKPDIVVTDIRMPYIDGLEFITRAKEIDPDIQFIIISGHDEFEYAQKALKLGVCDFLLKPLDNEELQELLVERKTQIEKNRKQKRDLSIRDSFLRLNKQNEKEESDYHCIMLVKYDDYSSIEGTPTEFYSEIESISSTVSDTALLESRNGSATLCLSNIEKEKLQSNINTFIRSLRMSRTLKQNYSCTIGVGMIIQGTQQLNASFEEAKSALNQKFLEGKNKTFYFDKLQSSDLEGLTIDMKDLDYSELLQSIRNGEKELMEACLNRLIRTTALMGKDSFAYGLMIAGNVFTESLKILDESGSDSIELLGNPMTVYEKITSRQTMEEMFQQLRLNLVKIQKHLFLKSSGGNDLLFHKIKIWINSRFSDPSLNLKQTADNFNISQGHLCSIFSSYSDETFTEYLTTVRINKARDLIISSDYMVYEIAYKVGYNNPTYFNSVFKKITGLSPGQYKKHNNKSRIK